MFQPDSYFKCIWGWKGAGGFLSDYLGFSVFCHSLGRSIMFSHCISDLEFLFFVNQEIRFERHWLNINKSLLIFQFGNSSVFPLTSLNMEEETDLTNSLLNGKQGNAGNQKYICPHDAK